MTCIAGVVDQGRVYLAADSSASSDIFISKRQEAKLFRKGEMVIGYCASFRVGQLLKYKLNLPTDSEEDAYAYMCTDFVDTIKKLIEENTDKDETLNLLVGYRGRLFEVGCSYEVGEYTEEYSAIGCGFQYALGALYSSKGLPVKNRLDYAIQASAEYSPFVCLPIAYLDEEIKKNEY